MYTPVLPHVPRTLPQNGYLHPIPSAPLPKPSLQASEILSTAHTTKTDQQRRPRGRRIRQDKSEKAKQVDLAGSIQPSQVVVSSCNNMERKQTDGGWCCSLLLLISAGTVSASSRGALGGHPVVESVDGAADAAEGEEDLVSVSSCGVKMWDEVA